MKLINNKAEKFPFNDNIKEIQEHQICYFYIFYIFSDKFAINSFIRINFQFFIFYLQSKYIKLFINRMKSTIVLVIILICLISNAFLLHENNKNGLTSNEMKIKRGARR